MTALYVIFGLIYLFGMILCYDMIAKDERFQDEFEETNKLIPRWACYLLMFAVLLVWPVPLLYGVFIAMFEKRGK